MEVPFVDTLPGGYVQLPRSHFHWGSAVLARVVVNATSRYGAALPRPEPISDSEGQVRIANCAVYRPDPGLGLVLQLQVQSNFEVSQWSPVSYALGGHKTTKLSRVLSESDVSLSWTGEPAPMK